MKFAQVALDVPVQEAFDFRVPPDLGIGVGNLVVVPFGRVQKVGVVVGLSPRSQVAPEKLRDIARAIDDVAPIAARDLELLRFCADYYQRPLGEVVATSLPPRIRQVRRRAFAPMVASHPPAGAFAPGVTLTPEQVSAAAMVSEGAGRFHPVLLHGVTGSGKSEVYWRVVADVLGRGRQALVLVPEIGLTPQLEAQVRARFPSAAIVAAHSHLGEGERAQAWRAAQSGAAHIVLGTRLAALMPFADLGLIVVDEEHDPSYKQQEGLRYSARDLAVRRAQMLAIPVILGSATPSLESYANAKQGRYALATLAERAIAGAKLPAVRIVDTRADRPAEGLASALVGALRDRLARREQSLVFVNRRGFAPVLHCRDCEWHSACARCSANLVLHLRSRELRCHHCGHVERVAPRCPSCGGLDLVPVGHGTQRVEETLAALFPQARIARVDRDSTARKGAMARVHERVHAGDIDILVGTQMLAKGHDYPNLTLVGALDADSALFSADFRAAERLFAQLVQVAGRAGRAGIAGEMLVQTDFPTHPLFAAVALHDYTRFADEALEERRLAGFPPFSHLALLRAESKKAGEALAFLEAAAGLARRAAAQRKPSGSIEVFDPVPAPLERKAGFERAQLLVRARDRAKLRTFLGEWKAALDARAERRVRWALDVDPQEV